jgi:quercetin dioxygenase-like cupin family protein
MRRVKTRTFLFSFLPNPILLAAFLALSVASAPDPAAAEEIYPRVQKLLQAEETVVGEKLAYPNDGRAQVTAVIVTLQPGEETGWHLHNVPLFAYILQGEVTVDYGPHGKKTYRAGDSLMEATPAVHNGIGSGEGPVRILAVLLGAEGMVNTEKAEAPAP